ncbi:MAG: hypothetical protein MUF87_20825, partial [Anaerolineae bacterium]|nr:hypothetical protein [Anaerolineae bacterium]
MFNLGIDPIPMIPPMIRILLITLLLSVAGMIGVIYQHRQQLLQQTDLANFSGATARPLDQVITQSMPLLLKRNIVVAILYLFSILSFTLLINALVMDLTRSSTSSSSLSPSWLILPLIAPIYVWIWHGIALGVDRFGFREYRKLILSELHKASPLPMIFLAVLVAAFSSAII